MRQEALEYFQKKLKSLPDAKERSFKRVLPKNIEEVKKIHVSAICGTAMGSLAVLLKEAGYEISGSDEQRYPPMSDLIDSLGIDYKDGFDESHIDGADVVIVGNACAPSNPEALAARRKKIPTLTLPEAISCFIIKDRKPIVVSGTHGKTTTTGLLSHVLLSAGFDPGYLFGGVPQGGEENARIGKGEYFVIEGDEYDTAYFDKAPKFLHYNPYISIITSLEYDHVDIYKDLEDYTNAFRFLVQEIPDDGGIFLYGDDPNVRVLGQCAECEVMYYGLGERNDITAREIEIRKDGQEFELIIKGESMGRFNIPLYGKHNLLNTLAVCGASIRAGISLHALRDGLKNFKGVKRRQEVIYDKSIAIIDDFAHHPTAVSETISAIRSKYPDRRLVVFFEPRSASSRRKIFEEDYGKSFDEADIVFISTPKLRPVDDPSDFIHPDLVVNLIKERGTIATCYDNPEDLLADAINQIKPADVVLIMSNGPFGGIYQKLIEKAENLPKE
jgi:UDP-N-acetylmuramate: L-alanyl-gamma-D-glutamyl-meso-diaminopimelate ligase